MKSNVFKAIFATLIFSFSVFLLRAQTPVIGKALDYPGQQMVAYRYMDLFSAVQEKIGSSKIDANGNFEMSLPIKEDQLITFVVNRIQAEVLIHANDENTISFYQPAKGTPRTYANTATLAESSFLVNNDLQSFDNAYEQFLQESSFSLKLKMFAGKSFQKSHAESLKGFQVKNIEKSDSIALQQVQSYGDQLEAFETKMREKYRSTMDTSTFFNDYVEYSFANLQLINHAREKIYESYLKRELNFKNPAVTSFFSNFYHNLWDQKNQERTLLSILKKERNFYSLDTAALKIPYLENSAIRHLALINGMYQAYTSKLANQEMLLTLLVREAKKSNTFASSVAENYVNKIIQYKKGVRIRAFKMLDKKENIVTLEDLQGKMVYINFFTSWCNSCEGEMYIMNNLKKKYGKEISFVSINMDDNYEDFKTFLSRHRQFGWKFLYGPSEEEVLNIFNIQTIPTYIFLDADGNWVTANTKAPSEGISNDFDLIMRKAYKAPTRYKVWDD